MSDPQQPQPPQTASYPGFPVSAKGLQKLHQALGMYLHQALEQDITATDRQEQHQQQVAALVAQIEAREPVPTTAPEQAPPVPLRQPKAQGG